MAHGIHADDSIAIEVRSDQQSSNPSSFCTLSNFSDYNIIVILQNILS